MRCRTAFVAAALLAAAPAAAQDMGWNMIIPSVAGTDALGLYFREQAQRRSPQPRRTPSSPEPEPDAAPAPADEARLRYTPSRSRRQTNQARFVAKTRAVDTGNAEDLQRLFAQGDLFEKLGVAMAPLGLRIDNVADAYAAWLITAWYASQGRNDTPSRRMTQAVRAQMVRALSATGTIAAASDAAKQELAESLLVQMIFVDVAVEQNKGKPDQLRAIAAAVAQGARRMGVDLAALKLTEDGFVPG
jgi:hypothetical protein